MFLTAAVPNPTNPALPNPAWTLPVAGLGPFGSTAGCKGDKWPNGHCSMKLVADPAKPNYFKTDAASELHLHGSALPVALASGMHSCTALQACHRQDRHGVALTTAAHCPPPAQQAQCACATHAVPP